MKKYCSKFASMTAIKSSSDYKRILRRVDSHRCTSPELRSRVAWVGLAAQRSAGGERKWTWAGGGVQDMGKMRWDTTRGGQTGQCGALKAAQTRRRHGTRQWNGAFKPYSCSDRLCYICGLPKVPHEHICPPQWKHFNNLCWWINGEYAAADADQQCHDYKVFGAPARLALIQSLQEFMFVMQYATISFPPGSVPDHSIFLQSSYGARSVITNTTTAEHGKTKCRRKIDIKNANNDNMLCYQQHIEHALERGQKSMYICQADTIESVFTFADTKDCPEDHYPCGEGDMCLPSHLWCDQNPDCLDSRDEGQICSKTGCNENIQFNCDFYCYSKFYDWCDGFVKHCNDGKDELCGAASVEYLGSRDEM